MAARVIRAGQRRERGIFSLVEVLLATLVLALSATTTAYWVETVGNLGTDADEQTIGLTIARTMEGIISPLAFREPGGGSSLGPEVGESLLEFEDIDDFNGFTSNPPIDGDRSPQSAFVNWTVSVSVEPVDSTTLNVVSTSDVRRVRVIATRKGREIKDVWWLRTRSPSE